MLVAGDINGGVLHNDLLYQLTVDSEQLTVVVSLRDIF